MYISDTIVESLIKENVDTVFGYPGGAVVPLYESLRKSKINHVLVRHEQAAAHSASGYSRSSGKVGVCMATSGPGATNLITGIATAYMDSIPMVVITGQVGSESIGKDVFQEADVVGSTEPFTKHNYLVKDPDDIPRIIREAFYIANTGRKGPVLIDIPVDLQRLKAKKKLSNEMDIPGYKPTVKGHIGQIKRALRKIKSAKRPVICAGGGIISSGACEELRIFVKKSGIPVVHTLMGIGCVETNCESYIGMLGSHGHKKANEVISRADLIVVVGTRLGDRATIGNRILDEMPDIIHIDIDPAEVGKIVESTIPLVGDANNILSRLNKEIKPVDIAPWKEEIKGIEEKPSNDDMKEGYLNPREAILTLSKYLDGNAVVTADVGQNQIWAARNIVIKDNMKFFTSGGLGTMGYSLPAAIGAKVANPEGKVVCVLGDGGLQMSLGELGTLANVKGGMVVLLINNGRLGMVRELQDIHVGKGVYYGIDLMNNPDFGLIAEAYGMKKCRPSSMEEFDSVIEKAIKSDDKWLVECVVDPDIWSTI
ncbi:MAG: biosynthetic-type acetolactate synthase large subunit [Firmicutes bacterium]|jgi:acetolactate synthase-1/2/3 large subunit|nr:biosynthetic-type acetolactate synthase large subunit [Bacillota bacterium]